MFEMTGLSSRAQQLSIRAIDTSGNLSPAGEIITFTPVSNPTFPQIKIADGMQLQNVVVGELRQIQVVDTNSTPRTYTLLNSQSDATIDLLTGIITWTPSYANVGERTIFIRATNEFGYRDLSISFPVYLLAPLKTSPTPERNK